MRVSSKTDYALKTVLDLAMHRTEGPIRVSDIAHRQHIPPKFLEQILLLLKGGGLVTSRRGAKGGYILAVPPSTITLASIVQLTEDSLLSSSASGRATGHDTAVVQECPFREIWEEVSGYLSTKLAEITMLDMCTRAQHLAAKRALEYCI